MPLGPQGERQPGAQLQQQEAAALAQTAIRTQRGNKVFVRVEGFHASLVLEVPDTESLVISTAQNKLSPRMEQDATYPVIMAHLVHKERSVSRLRAEHPTPRTRAH